MTTAESRTLPGAYQRPPSVMVSPPVVDQFRQNRQARDQPRSGVLFGRWSPGGGEIEITETVSWTDAVQRETLPPHLFAVNAAYLAGCQDILHRHDQAVYARLQKYRNRGYSQRQPITQVGHWLVMPKAVLAPGEDAVDAMRQARGRELALLERALEAGWLDGPQLITVVREEARRLRVRVYGVGPGLPIRRVPFQEDELNTVALGWPPFRLPIEEDTEPVG
ncbi:hypothetical protein ACI3L1_18600 [Deinococcus sp. SM5_A1]|uniref:hypothetical protein n=1 Tax=Deinococcus sp. SM5_A1 TaxID=3379094 RepID=UPI00385E063D